MSDQAADKEKDLTDKLLALEVEMGKQIAENKLLLEGLKQLKEKQASKGCNVGSRFAIGSLVSYICGMVGVSTLVLVVSCHVSWGIS